MTLYTQIREKIKGSNSANVIASDDNTKLYVLTKISSQIREAIPRSKVINNPDNPLEDELIVECDWTFENACTLAELGAASLSPIIQKDAYDWPGELTPFKHQYLISAFLSIHKRAFCLADMGTGKTLATLHAINYLYRIGKIKKVLIVCPLSVMRDAWFATLRSMDCELKCDILYSTNKKRRIEIINNSTSQIHIINPDGVEVICSELLKQKYDMVVIDELTTYKTHTTARWKNLNKITTHCDYVWGITGTPVPNSPIEAYGQIKMVCPKNLENVGFSEFKETMDKKFNSKFLESSCNSQEEFNSVETSLELVYNYFNPAIRIKKEDCLDLPDMVSVYIHCDLSPDQKSIINRIREHGMIYLQNGGSLSAINGQATVAKIVQACCGAVYDNYGEPLFLNAKTRIAEVIRLIGEAKSERTEKNKGKTLVFAPFKSAVDLLEREIGKKFKVVKINSDVKEKERADIFNRLQNTDDLDVIVAIPTTMSHGITATSASLIIWYAPIHSCETYIQACNRINRAGQTQKMTIAHLYGTEIESRIYKSLENKQLNLKRLLNLYTEFIKGI